MAHAQKEANRVREGLVPVQEEATHILAKTDTEANAIKALAAASIGNLDQREAELSRRENELAAARLDAVGIVDAGRRQAEAIQQDAEELLAQARQAHTDTQAAVDRMRAKIQAGKSEGRPRRRAKR